MFDEVISRAKPFSDADKKAMEPIAGAFDKAGRDLQQYAFQRTGELIRASLPALKESLRSDQRPTPTPSYEEMQNQLGLTRKALHEIRREEIAKGYPIIRAGCEKLYSTLQVMVREVEQDQRGGILARWRMTFRPSGVLQGLIYFALSATRPILDFEDGAFLTPSCDPRSLWGFVIEQAPAKPTGLTMAETREMQRSQEDARRAREMAEERAEQKRQLAEINRLNDAIRNKTAPPAPLGYSVPEKAPTTEAKP
jgi:hypothetical protein